MTHFLQSDRGAAASFAGMVIQAIEYLSRQVRNDVCFGTRQNSLSGEVAVEDVYVRIDQQQRVRHDIKCRSEFCPEILFICVLHIGDPSFMSSNRGGVAARFRLASAVPAFFERASHPVIGESRGNLNHKAKAAGI